MANIRKCVFWLVDRLKGGRIKKEYDDIRRKMLITDKNEINKSLQELIKHAIESVPYYKELTPHLLDFPVVNKNIIKENSINHVSTKFNISELKKVITSGSTGTPFSVYVDSRKTIRNNADTIYFSQIAGYDFGNPLLYMKIWVKEKMLRPIVYVIRNINPIDVISFSNKEIEFILKRIKLGKHSILAYASVLDILSKYMSEHNLTLDKNSVNAIISMSETLTLETKSNLSKRCGVCVVSRYSDLECGIIAQQLTDETSKYLINRASYHVEILKIDSDEAVQIGELGRIVVTDLYNYAQPMIRYDTGDIGAFEDCEMTFISTVEGRKLDLIYNTKGELVSSYIVYKNMWQYTEIDQYQLIQETQKEYKIKISSKEGFHREDKLVSEFSLYLGDDADITIEYVDEIPLLASGKRKKIVNNYVNTTKIN